MGISLGIDRIVKVMERESLFKLPKTNTKVFVAPIDDEMRATAIKITQILREKEIPSEVDVMGRKLPDQLKYVDKKEIPYAVIIGKKELENEFVVLRDMREKTQREVKISVLPTIFVDLLKKD